MRVFWVSFVLLASLTWTCQSPSSQDAEGSKDPGVSAERDNRSEHGDENFEALVRKYESEDRVQWQKPDQVIAMMGDLGGKTVADIGAGTGYFSFRILPKADTVIAIDIDPRMVAFIDSSKKRLPNEFRSRLITRLAEPMDPKLKEGEADIVFLANTYIYIERRIDYFSELKSSIAPGGALMILDYKKKQLPLGPPQSVKISLSRVEQELQQAGYERIYSDDQTLPYQYIVIALPEQNEPPPVDTMMK